MFGEKTIAATKENIQEAVGEVKDAAKEFKKTAVKATQTQEATAALIKTVSEVLVEFKPVINHMIKNSVIDDDLKLMAKISGFAGDIENITDGDIKSLVISKLTGMINKI